jgi:hypothetical protein
MDHQHGRDEQQLSTSTPTLNISSAIGIAFCGRRTCASAPSKTKAVQ